jgi:hypothetical protein
METLKFVVLAAAGVFVFFLIQDMILSIWDEVKEHLNAKNKSR